MNHTTFPSNVGELMRLILGCYLPRRTADGSATISKAEFAEGAGHAYTQMYALVLTNKRRKFCWSLAQFVSQTLVLLLTAKRCISTMRSAP
jgi:hypothetical protein